MARINMGAAPDLPGYEYVRPIGKGGFADVFLYQQLNPQRQVAVKVLRSINLPQAALDGFVEEGNAMASLEHPFISRVYSVGTAPDGRPYLVMAYYAQGSLAELVRSEPLSVPEVLRIGIQLSAAIETAHRTGLLHRDIKPANVLIGQYGDLGLTDFGIAGRSNSTEEEETGLSIPWAAPELVFRTYPPSVQSDVYSLGATMWHLLSGRSPFYVSTPNDNIYNMMSRIRDESPQPLSRPDVPGSLDRLLRQTLAKNPELRPQSALALAQSLQAIEQELRLGRTPIALAQEPTTARPKTPTAESTMLKPLTKVDATPAKQAPSSWDPSVANPYTPAKAIIDDDVTRKKQPDIPNPPPPPPVEGSEPKSKAPLIMAAIVALVAIAVGIAFFVGGNSTTQTPDVPTVTPPPPELGEPQTPLGPVTVTAKRNGETVTFTWKYSGQSDTDTFRWRIVGQESVKTTEKPSVTQTTKDRLCIEVQVIRADGKTGTQPWSAPGCG